MKFDKYFWKAWAFVVFIPLSLVAVVGIGLIIENVFGNTGVIIYVASVFLLASIPAANERAEDERP